MKDAFTEVCAIVDSKLIKEGGIIKLSDLREIYVARLEKTPFSNPKYRSGSLKAKFVKCYNEHLSFVQLGTTGKVSIIIGAQIICRHWLPYSNDI